jgi:cytochrome c peroxidase
VSARIAEARACDGGDRREVVSETRDTGCAAAGRQASRAPHHVYKTMNLNGLFVREEGLFMAPANKGRYYHDGRFKTLLDVVNHYDTCKSLGLTESEKHDVVEYLKSLPES